MAIITLAWSPVTNAASYRVHEGGESRVYTNHFVAYSNNLTIPFGAIPRFYSVSTVASNGMVSTNSREATVNFPRTNIVLSWAGQGAVISNAPVPAGPYVPKTNVTGTNAVAIRMNGSNEFFKADKPLTIESQKP